MTSFGNKFCYEVTASSKLQDFSFRKKKKTVVQLCDANVMLMHERHKMGLCKYISLIEMNEESASLTQW